MDITTLSGLFKELGLGIGLVVVVVVALLYLIKSLKLWYEKALEREENLLERAKQERDASWRVIDGFRASVDSHCNSAMEFHRQVSNAHEFQRAEHKEHKDSVSDVAIALTEIVTLLKAMNNK